MIETILTVAWYAFLVCIGISALVIGAAISLNRYAAHRDDQERREYIASVAAQLREERDAATLPSARGSVIDKNHPLYCHGARRGPEPPAQSLHGRFR